MRKIKNNLSMLLIIFILGLMWYYKDYILGYVYNYVNKNVMSYSIQNIPEYSGDSYIIINNDEPDFEDKYKNKNSFEDYSDLDELGRAGVAFANIGIDLMPTKERESIGMIKPSGWHIIKYDIIEEEYLYNRCHLIAYQLTGENANEKNLITCTRQMNTIGMLPFENKVGNYIRKTKNHVLYRVTPIYYEDDLLSRGVNIEAYSVEDQGKGIKFNVFIYNVQDGISIDYKTGYSHLIK